MEQENGAEGADAAGAGVAVGLPAGVATFAGAAVGLPAGAGVG